MNTAISKRLAVLEAKKTATLWPSGNPVMPPSYWLAREYLREQGDPVELAAPDWMDVSMAEWLSLILEMRASV